MKVLIATGYGTSIENVSINQDGFNSRKEMLNAIAKELKIYVGQVLNVYYKKPTRRY